MKSIFLLLLFTLNTFTLWAQQDTSGQVVDSTTNQINSQLNRIRQLSAERLADSLKRVDLEQQVARLSNADNLKKSTLLKELNGLKQQDSLRLIRQKHQIDSLRRFVKGYPVVFAHQTLFTLFVRQGSFTPAERAQAIEHRLEKLGETYGFKTDSLKLVPAEQTTDIVYHEQLLLSVSEQDALWQNSNRPALAAQYRNAIGKAVVLYQQEHSWQTLLKEGLMAALVIASVLLFIYCINRLFSWLLMKFRAHPGKHTNGIYIRNYELLNAEQQFRMVTGALKLIKWGLILLAVFLALPALFSIFPFTKNISTTLLGYVINPLRAVGLAIWRYVPNLITILVLIIIFRYVLRFFKYIKTEVERERLSIPGFYPDWANPTYQILRVLILLFMLIIIYPYLPGSESPIFKGVSVFAGVLFTFGSAGALGNIVAGLVLTYMRAFKIGDRVKINDVTGDIIEKSLLVTRVKTIQNEIISIPNSMVMGNYTVNYSSDASGNGLIVNTTVTMGYDTPWRQVHQLLIKAALATPMIEPMPEPYVLQTSLDDYYVSYRLNAYTKQPSRQAVIYSALHANIQDKFFEAGVEIMSPHYRAVRDGSALAVPPPDQQTRSAPPTQN
ncbi:mechanosensitive ion channel [Mucilaginibacter koreensis]